MVAFVYADDEIAVGASTINIATTSGVAAGQRAIAAWVCNDAGAQLPLPTSPGATPWTRLGTGDYGTVSDIRIAVYTKVLEAADVDANVTFTTPGSVNRNHAAMLGVWGQSEIDVWDRLDADSPSLSAQPPRVTTTAAAARVVYVVGTNADAGPPTELTWTTAPGTTQREQMRVTTPSRFAAAILSDEEQVAAGLTTQRTFTADTQARRNMWTISLIGDRPTANAGPDRFVASGGSGQFDGSASGGSGGYTYLWSHVSGAVLTLNDATDPDTTFDAPTVTQTASSVYQLVATDSGGAVSLPDQVQVTILGPGSIARPFADITATNWTGEPPSSPLALLLADGSDATRIVSLANPTAQIYESQLTPLIIQDTTVPVTIGTRMLLGAGTGSVQFWLRQGASTIIAGPFNHTFSGPAQMQEFTNQLTQQQVQSIVTAGDPPEATDLRLRWSVTAAE